MTDRRCPRPRPYNPVGIRAAAIAPPPRTPDPDDKELRDSRGPLAQHVKEFVLQATLTAKETQVCRGEAAHRQEQNRRKLGFPSLGQGCDAGTSIGHDSVWLPRPTPQPGLESRSFGPTRSVPPPQAPLFIGISIPTARRPSQSSRHTPSIHSSHPQRDVERQSRSRCACCCNRPKPDRHCQADAQNAEHGKAADQRPEGISVPADPRSPR